MDELADNWRREGETIVRDNDFELARRIEALG
jgi:hypothetical protein